MTQLDSNVNEALRTNQSDTLSLTLSHCRVNKGPTSKCQPAAKEPLQDCDRLALSICSTWWASSSLFLQTPSFEQVKHLKATTSSDWPSLPSEVFCSRCSFKTVLILPPTDCVHLEVSFCKKEDKHYRTKNVTHCWWTLEIMLELYKHLSWREGLLGPIEWFQSEFCSPLFPSGLASSLWPLSDFESVKSVFNCDATWQEQVFSPSARRNVVT